MKTTSTTKKTCLLETALACCKARQPVIAVGADKRPCRKGWNAYFIRQQTEQEVKEQFSNGATGIARILYPACQYVHLDFDGEHANNAWLETGIMLPKTVRLKTPSGGFHLVYRASSFLKNATGLKRAVRLIEADCQCKKSCGVDFLVRGYALIPPSPGYSWEPTIKDAAEIPDELVRLATGKRKREFVFTREIPKGKRNVTLLSTGGVHRRQGKGYDELVEILSRENESRCQPPLEKADVEKIAKSLCNYEPAKPEQQEVKSSFVAIEAIARENTSWLWEKRIALGRITQIGGDPGAGKSFLSLAIAASVSRGEALPGGKKPSGPFFVLLFSVEDGISDTVRPRLESLNANLSRIIIPDPRSNLSNPLNSMENAVREYGPAVVIVDPIQAFLGKTDNNRASEVREFLAPLMLLAGEQGFACLLLGHLNKQTSFRAIYRNSGSIDFVAACRSCFIVAEDTEEPGRRVLAHIKNSLAPRQPSLSFYIDENGFRWGEEVNMTADELLNTGPTRNRERHQLEAAMAFLQEVLANGPIPSEKVKDKGRLKGISGRTIWRAKDELGIEARKERFGPWWWSLPSVPSEDKT